MSYIFISYSKKNKQYAYALAEFLQKAGFDIWIDRADIEYGVDWWDAIVEGVRGCGAFVPVMTPEAKTSPWVKREVFLALEWQKPTFPLLLNGGNWELFVLTQFVDVTHAGMPDDEFLERLAQYITPQNMSGRDHFVLLSSPATPTLSQPDSSVDLEHIIAEFGRAFKRKDWAMAMELLGRMRASGEDTSPFDPDAFEARVQIAVEAENTQREKERFEVERAKQYQRLVAMTDYADEKLIRQALRKFWQTFPDYDPQGLIKHITQIRVQDSVKRSNILDILPQPFEWISIPAGKVTLEDASSNRGTQGGVYEVPAFQIAQYPITNAHYQVFADNKDGYANTQWWDFLAEAKEFRQKNATAYRTGFDGDLMPHTNVTWYDALAFCRWQSAKWGENITLPTELQWQRAAQGNDGREYPWGNGFDKRRTNTNESALQKTTPVNQYPNGASPYEVMDMAGNVYEWCLSEWGTDDISINNNMRVVRGGSWDHNSYDASVSDRYWFNPNRRSNYLGFRVCVSS